MTPARTSRLAHEDAEGSTDTVSGSRPGPASPRRRAAGPAVGLAVGLVLAVLAACTSTPPPPVVGQVPPAPAPQIEPNPSQLRLGVDDLGIGFNPHRVADLTPASRATAALVLPSVFRPGADGAPRLDTTVVTSATVTSTRPFTVSYEIAPAATWSDNAPVAAEDFVYLWQQMRSQPGVVGAAGYRAVSDVRSRAGGKAVDVVFDRPYPAWRSLFDNLLPAHLLKDAPGAWGGALTDSIPVSAGPFVVKIVDRIRGQVTLARNDRFWGTPAVPDEVVLQAADHASLLDRIRSGDVQASQFRADGTDLAALGVGPPVTSRTLPEPQLVQLVLRSDDGPLADVRVRRAVAASLDRSALIAAGTDGGPAATLRADAFATAPSAPGYRSTLTAASPAVERDPGRAAALLAEAGYVRGGDGLWARDGRPLTLRIAAPPQVSPYGRLIGPMITQLRAAGVDTVVVADAGANPFPPGRGPLPSSTPTPPTTAPGPPAPGAPAPTPATTASSSGTRSSTTTTSVPPTPDSPSDLAVADVSVLALPIGTDPIADLTSAVGCPGRRPPSTSGTLPEPATTGPPAGGVPTTPATSATSTGPSSTSAAVPGPAGATTSGAEPARSSTTSTTAPDELGDPRASDSLSASGWCDPALQAVLDAAAAGSVSRETALALTEPILWQALPTIPLFQAASVLVTPVDRTDVVAGPLTASPFAGVAGSVPPPRSARDDDGVN